MATAKEKANYIATTKQGEKGKAISELVLGVYWFQKELYEADIFQNAFYKYVHVKISPPYKVQ